MVVHDTILTKEERDVLILSAPNVSGYQLNSTEIGERLGLSTTRVKTLIHQACVKLRAHNRMEGIFVAIKQGQIRLDEIYSLDELAQLWIALYPDLRKIIYNMTKELEHKELHEKDNEIEHTGKRQGAILTRSERDVIILVGRGLTNKLIADRLYISPNGVAILLFRACAKLGAHRRMEAVVLALKRGEISLGDILSFSELVRPFTILGTKSLEKIEQLMSHKLGQESTSSEKLI